METQGEHKRDKALMAFWISIGIGIGITIGASTKDWAIGLLSGLVLGVGMALFATKAGMD